MVFFDTNIFVDAVSTAGEDQEKRRIARMLLAGEEFSLSLRLNRAIFTPPSLP